MQLIQIVRKCQRWCSRFCSPNFGCEDATRNDLSIQFDKDVLRAIAEENPFKVTKEILKMYNVSWPRVQHLLKSIGKFQHTDK